MVQLFTQNPIAQPIINRLKNNLLYVENLLSLFRNYEKLIPQIII